MAQFWEKGNFYFVQWKRAEKYAMLGKLSNGIRSVGAFFVPLPEGRRAVCVRI